MVLQTLGRVGPAVEYVLRTSITGACCGPVFLTSTPARRLTVRVGVGGVEMVSRKAVRRLAVWRWLDTHGPECSDFRDRGNEVHHGRSWDLPIGAASPFKIGVHVVSSSVTENNCTVPRVARLRCRKGWKKGWAHVLFNFQV